MRSIDFNRKITENDVKELNEQKIILIQVESTANQDIDIISKLNKNCLIRIFPKNFEKYSKILKESCMLYTTEEFCEILSFLNKLDREIDKSWSDLEKVVYIYTELQKLPKNLKSDIGSMFDLSSVATKSANSQGMASILYEAMKRQNIPCRYTFNDKYEAWNEVKIGDKFYPVDLYEDTKNYSDLLEKTNGDTNPLLDNFATKDFYSKKSHNPCKEAELLSAKELKEVRALEDDALKKTYGKLQEKISIKERKEQEKEIKKEENKEDKREIGREENKEDKREIGREENKEDKKEIKREDYVAPEPIERKDIKLKSKELAKAFEKGEIIASTYDGQSSVTIEATDNKLDDLVEDLNEIGKYYPELLKTVELKNETNTHINFQEVIDKIYSIKKDNPYVDGRTSSIKIATANPEDFDLDFSKAPKIKEIPELQSDGEQVYQEVQFINTDPTKPMKLPKFKSNIPETITALSFENINFDGVSVTYDDADKIKKFSISGVGTQNVNAIPGITKAHSIEITKISDGELNSFIGNVYDTCTSLDKIRISQQKLRGSRILKELAKNKNVSMVTIDSSKLDNLDGLEDFDGRIAECNLMGNELDSSAITKMEEFKEKNPYFFYNLTGNSEIARKISLLPKISNETHKFIADYIAESGTIRRYLDKEACVNILLDDKLSTLPIYAKDAHLIRTELGLKRISMMVKDNAEIDSLNFNNPAMQGGTMLLTIPQIEHLLSTGKVIPQDVRIKIEDVTQLDNAKLENLEQRMNAKGMKISSVQIFDKDNNNNWQMIGPYTVDNYKKIRTVLEKIVEGIDPSEPDIDKFVTIYMRMAESIPYDKTVVDRPDMKVAGGLRYSKYIYAARNLEEGTLEGTCVCSGYADIMRNALAMVGMECKTNSGLTYAVNGGGHAWNQVKIDGKWYYSDVTWDEKRSKVNPKSRNYNWILLGKDEFTNNGHQITETKKIANVEKDKYPRNKLKEAINRNEHRSFDFTVPDITIEPDPTLNIQLDDQRIKDEYKRRRDDMLAKYYGDKDYREEYKIRSERFKSHELEVNAGGSSYKTVSNYPEKADDEAFLFLDGYQNALERSTKFEAGDTSIYASYSDPKAEYQKDKEYVETRNNTFNQHENTQKDLATLGKYGERVPYIPKRQGFIKNVARAVANTGIFVRNMVAPVYRFCGKYIGQPIHRLITRNSDASPYRNNFYHRMVARRDYFADLAAKRDEQETANLRAAASDPTTVKPVSHPIRNAITSRFKAIFNVKQGNKAVLSAGLSDIKNNIQRQEGQKAMILAIERQIMEITAQITRLETQINANPNARNITDAKKELSRKKLNLQAAKDRLDIAKAQDTIYSKQTDAIDARQHSIASKEVNTLRATVIKGAAKGVAVKYLGPKIRDFILERNKKSQTVDVPNKTTTETREWVDPTYRTETEIIYGDVVDKTSSVKDMMAANKGNSVTGYYSVYGGEKGAAIYELTGDEKITGIFQSVQNGGKGLSDTVGLEAPTLTDGTFAKDLLTDSGLLNQDISVETLVSALNANKVDFSAMSDVYVAVSDKCWVKLSDLLPGITKREKIDEIVKTVLETEGGWKTVESVVDTVDKATTVVNNPAVEKGVNMTGDILKGLIIGDGILDLNENLRKTNSDKKKTTKDYTFDDDEAKNIPTSRKEYENER